MQPFRLPATEPPGNAFSCSSKTPFAQTILIYDLRSKKHCPARKVATETLHFQSGDELRWRFSQWWRLSKSKWAREPVVLPLSSVHPGVRTLCEASSTS